MPTTIDLRNQNKTAASKLVTPPAQKLPVAESSDEISWSAEEYEKVERGPYWYVAVIGIATALIILGVFARSYFFIALVLLASLTLVAYAKREPRKLACRITEEGVQIGNTFFDYKNLKSFWIFGRTLPEELSLETTKTLNPFVRIPLTGVSAQNVKSYLAKFIPEKEHGEEVTNQLAKILKL